ncbi:Zn-dependent alcohol dehydrogenase, partial [Escherichia coli]|nr:Zn-dependent alcohol dehydrogenase [Escherichia coli]
ECRACKAGRFNLCEPPQVAGFRAPGFARSQHIVPARNCHVAPASLPLKVLAFAEPAACARHCVNRMPKASLESVLVIGAGTIGLSIVQALRIMGAGKITVIEPDAAKRALALKLGAAEV